MAQLDPALANLAQMLKSTQSRRVDETRPAQSSVTIRPNAPALPSFAPSGGASMLPSLADYMKPQKPVTPTLPQMPPGQAPASPPPTVSPGDQPGALPPMPAPVQIGAAPGMMAMPQTGPDLETWRKLMDQMQFARQGA